MGQWTSDTRENNGVRYIAHIATNAFEIGTPRSKINEIVILDGNGDKEYESRIQNFWIGKTLTDWGMLEEPSFKEQEEQLTQPTAVCIQVCKLGIYGKAYDRLDSPRRAYTFDHQPDNIGASRLGRVAAYLPLRGGDHIDIGLSLLRLLQEHGFGIFEIEKKEGE